MDINFNSVEVVPDLKASAAFTVNSSEVFREDDDLSPVIIDERTKYMPWGADNEMPFKILDIIESDETLSTCQIFNAEVCYGSGLVYNTEAASEQVKGEVEEFMMDNSLAAYFLGVCQDFKHFAFCVSVIILNGAGDRIVRLIRKEACYCRFAEADKNGRIPYILYANWRRSNYRENIEKIALLDTNAPWADLSERMADKKNKLRKFAIVTKIPTVDST